MSRVRLAYPRRLAPCNWKGVPPTLAAGMRYEARVSRWLGMEYNFHPQIEFERSGGSRFIPDGLLFSPAWDKLCVVEIKTQHSQEAVGQLIWYCRWLSEWFPAAVTGLLITQVYRPELAYLGPGLVASPEVMLNHAGPHSCGVFIASPSGLPKLRGRSPSGPGLAQSLASSAVWAAGGGRNADGGSGWSALLDARQGAEVACAD